VALVLGLVKRIPPAAVVVAIVLSLAPSATAAQTPPPPCDPSTAAAARFVGLPAVVPFGQTESFGFEETTASDRKARLPIDVNMVDSAGESFFSGQMRRFDDEAYVVLDLGDGPVEIHAGYVEESPDGSTCTRSLTSRVRGVLRVYFPSRCSNLRQRPRNVTVACGDGNVRFRQLRWRGWNRPVARGRGTFHRLPVSVKLSGRRLCRNLERYVYTRISWRYRQRPAWLGRVSGNARFPCRMHGSS
jgi:hypothetical protein